MAGVLGSGAGARAGSEEPMKLAVVGAGVTGLDLAYRLARRGHAVTVFERDRTIGGLAGSFELRGRRVEKFYHFICKPDLAYLDRLADLGLAHLVRWRPTGMAYYLNGRLYDFSTPWALLKLDQLSLPGRFRYGLNVLSARLRTTWKDIEDVSAVDWLRSSMGPEAYNLLWSSLMEQKFREYTGRISAAWIWTRIRRIARSRRFLTHEELGYVEGGSDVIVEALARAIEARGGRIETSQAVRGLIVRDGRARGIVTAAGAREFDAVLSTAPLVLLGEWSGLPADLAARYRRIEHLGIVCSLLILDRPLTDVFWFNINDRSVPIPGFIEYTNLSANPDYAMVYVPEYLHRSHPRFAMKARALIDDHVSMLGRIVPGFGPARVLDAHVHRAEYGQAVYETGFSRLLPEIKTPLPGFYAADTCHFFPEDRSIAQSIELAGKMDAILAADTDSRGG